jgi:hypothetical protein
MNELNQLIADEQDPKKREILKKLRPYRKWAYLRMNEFGKNWKQKYYGLLNQKEWREARLLLKEYFTNNNKLMCSVCENEITKQQSFTLHHKDFYGKPQTFFIPLYCEITHTKCHRKGDPKKWK